MFCSGTPAGSSSCRSRSPTGPRTRRSSAPGWRSRGGSGRARRPICRDAAASRPRRRSSSAAATPSAFSRRCRTPRSCAPLRERALAGMPYLGASAGINLAGPTIRTTNDMPIVEPRGFDALGLVPFQINPALPRRRTGIDAIWARRAKSAWPSFTKRTPPWWSACAKAPGSASTATPAGSGGSRGARIFRRGAAPEERAPGAALDDLL